MKHKESPSQTILQNMTNAGDFNELKRIVDEAALVIWEDSKKKVGPCNFGQSDVLIIMSAFEKHPYNVDGTKHEEIFRIAKEAYKMDKVSLLG